MSEVEITSELALETSVILSNGLRDIWENASPLVNFETGYLLIKDSLDPFSNIAFYAPGSWSYVYTSKAGPVTIKG
jgi:hypothetical protein